MLGQLQDSGKYKYNFTVENPFLQSIKNIPIELRNIDNWLHSMKPFKYIENNDDPKYIHRQYNTNKGKYPCDINGSKLSYTNKNNWKSFNEVVKYNPLQLYHSFHLNNEYICIDIDNGYGNNFDLYEWASLIINQFKDAYIEKSVSGRGIHILFKNIGMKDLSLSVKANDLHKKYCAMPDKCKIEVFSNRPIILTGEIINNPVNIIKADEKLKNFISFIKSHRSYKERAKKEAKKKNIEFNNDVKTFNKIYSKSDNMENLFDFIKYEVDIKEVLQHYNINYSGKNILCPLPDHDEKNPSFRIYDYSNSFYCFSCHGGGSVIDFVMKMDQLDNPLLAAKKLNEMLNLKLDFDFEINPDFKKVKWNNDFVLVTYKDEEEGLKTIRLSEYNYKFKDMEEKPKMKKFNVLKVKENMKKLLDHYGYYLKFNIVKENYDIFKDDEKYNLNLDLFITEVRDMLIKHSQIMSKETILDSLKNIAFENKYNPIEEYLIQAQQYYLSNPNENILKELYNTIKSESIFKELFIEKFLLQMVYMICCTDESGISSQFVLVLQGEQGIGKTTWFKNILPKKFRFNYFLGGRCFDPNNKDHVIETFDNWLVEMGEIASTFRKADQENLKNFITAHQDKVRRPYGSEYILKKRRTSLCATTNDLEYLRDLTGNRRFLTLPCIDINWQHLDKIDLDMLWGCIYNMYKNHIKYTFENKEEKRIMNYNKEYLNKPEGLMLIEEKFDINPEIDEGDSWLSAKEIFDKLGFQQIIPSHFKLGKELKRFGVASKRHKQKGNLFNVRLKIDYV